MKIIKRVVHLSRCLFGANRKNKFSSMKLVLAKLVLKEISEPFLTISETNALIENCQNPKTMTSIKPAPSFVLKHFQAYFINKVVLDMSAHGELFGIPHGSPQKIFFEKIFKYLLTSFKPTNRYWSNSYKELLDPYLMLLSIAVALDNWQDFNSLLLKFDWKKANTFQRFLFDIIVVAFKTFSKHKNDISTFISRHAPQLVPELASASKDPTKFKKY